MSRIEDLKQKMADGHVAIGVFITMSDMSVGEMAGWAGYDFVWIDAEHAPLGRQEVFRLMAAAQSAGACAFIRVPGVDPHMTKAILDMGPDGIIFPFINTRELAETAIRSCAYPAGGIRGQGPIRAIRYGLEDEDEYIADAYSRVLKILQIETYEGYENLDDIMSVAGIGSIFIGGADLNRSLNDPSADGKKRYAEIFGDICRRVRANGLILGATAGAGDMKERREQGVNWLACGQDARILSQGLKNNLDGIRRMCT